MLAAGLTRSLVAAKETVASTRTIGNMGEAFVYNIMGRGNDGDLDRVLDLPTNEAWIDPWMRHLRTPRGPVRHGPAAWSGTTSAAAGSGRPGSRNGAGDADPGRGGLVRQRDAGRAGPQAPSATDLLRLDPSLHRLDELFTDWMVGIQYFLQAAGRPRPRATSRSSTRRGR